MPSNPLLVAAPIVGLATYCLAHVALARLLKSRSAYPPLMIGFAVGFAAALAMTIRGLRPFSGCAAEDVAGFLVLNGLTYAALGWCYFHFVNLCVASLRIRILEEIVENGGAIDAEALEALYDDRRMFLLRIERLSRGGHLVSVGDRFVIGKSLFLAVARIFDILRWCIIGVH